MKPSDTITSQQRESHLDVAVDAVARACRVARRVQQRLADLTALTKDDRSPVTVADFAVQAIVYRRLRTAFPEARMVGEEDAGALRKPEQAAVRDAVIQAVCEDDPEANEHDVLSALDACDHDARSELFWALDPVDGTKGFLRGQQYAIALALIEEGEVTLGVMGCPNLAIDQDHPLDQPDEQGSVYAASRGDGVWQRPAAGGGGWLKIACGTWEPAAAEAGAGIRTCESVESAHSKHDDTQRILAHLGYQMNPVRLDSQCKYAVVARGQADAYIRMPTRKGYVERIWDHAAGMLIATEAGARVTDITGRPLEFTHGAGLEANRGIVCAVPPVHERMIRAIDELGLAAG